MARQRSFSGKLPPKKPRNEAVRPREYLTEQEVEKLMDAARTSGRHGHRDSTLILIAYRHGLRASEVIALRWDQVDLHQGQLHVHRLKGGAPSVHPLRGPEHRALRRLQREYPETPYLFVTERGGPLTDSTVRKLVARAGRKAGFEFSVHPHMLRHATGFKLANEGHDTRSIQQYLGHRNIQHRPLHGTGGRAFSEFLERLTSKRRLSGKGIEDSHLTVVFCGASQSQ